jgi:transcriptional regulator with XRE-family HTH domain
MHFGKLLRKCRHEAGLNLLEVATELEVSISYLSDVERGRRNPFKPAEIRKIATMLRCDERELLRAAELWQPQTFRPGNDFQARAVLGLHRRWEELSEAEWERILKVLEQSKEEM